MCAGLSHGIANLISNDLGSVLGTGRPLGEDLRPREAPERGRGEAAAAAPAPALGPEVPAHGVLASPASSVLIH